MTFLGIFLISNKFYDEVKLWFPLLLFVLLYNLTGLLPIHLSPGFKIFFDFDQSFSYLILGKNTPLSFYLFKHHIPIFDVLFGTTYILQSIIPILIILYVRKFHSKSFYRLSLAGGIVGIVSILLSTFFPTFPPWYIYYYGTDNQIPVHLNPEFAAGGLIYLDRIFATNIFSQLMWNLSSSKFSAFPSLHVGTSTFLYFHFKFNSIKGRNILLIYLLLTCLSVSYLLHHWLLDSITGLIIGASTSFLTNKKFIDNFPNKI